MGLDMYAYLAKRKNKNAKGIYKTSDEFTADWHVVNNDYHYWRKNRHLNNWMAEKYLEFGGDDYFNCNFLVLTIDDIRNLHECIECGVVEQLDYTGFFWGNGDYAYKEEDLKFCKDAIAELEKLGDDYAIVYTNWW